MLKPDIDDLQTLCPFSHTPTPTVWLEFRITLFLNLVNELISDKHSVFQSHSGVV